MITNTGTSGNLYLVPSSTFCRGPIFIFFQLLLYASDPSHSFPVSALLQCFIAIFFHLLIHGRAPSPSSRDIFFPTLPAATVPSDCGMLGALPTSLVAKLGSLHAAVDKYRVMDETQKRNLNPSLWFEGSSQIDPVLVFHIYMVPTYHKIKAKR